MCSARNAWHWWQPNPPPGPIVIQILEMRRGPALGGPPWLLQNIILNNNWQQNRQFYSCDEFKIGYGNNIGSICSPFLAKIFPQNSETIVRRPGINACWSPWPTIKHHHHHIKESPCLHCSKSKKWVRLGSYPASHCNLLISFVDWHRFQNLKTQHFKELS